MKLILLGTAGIQRYIFGSNRLRDNLGGSYLVANATTRWAFELLPSPHNVVDAITGEFNSNCRIEDPPVAAEVLFAGGGNAAILFRDNDSAATFLCNISEKVLLEAPGLHLVAHEMIFDWGDRPSDLYDAVQDGMRSLDKEKLALNESEPLLGLGVTRSCHATGLPAVAFSPRFRLDEAVYPVSREVVAKQQSRRSANERLSELLPLTGGFVYPTELEDLGRSFGEFSYIGVVHIDGNSMGRRITNVGRGLSNREYAQAIRAFSNQLNRAGLESMQSCINNLVSRVDTKAAEIADLDAGLRGRRIALSPTDDGKLTLPIRPIIYGGDDVTFVCDGRLAIPLALHYMAEFERATAELSDGQGKAYSCAGVAIVKAHYPFARACDLAEQLCGSAKAFVRSRNVTASAIDWHFANAGLAGDLDQIRQREFCTVHGQLNLRPVTVSREQVGVRTWKTVQTGIDRFRENWIQRRNKIKGLRDALRYGPDRTRAFCEKYLTIDNQELPCLGLDKAGYRLSGWLEDTGEKRCAYFDAIELADFQFSLTVPTGADATAIHQGVSV